MINDHNNSELINEKTRALLNFADKITRYPDQLSEQDTHTLRDHGLKDDQILEAAMVAAVFNMMDRLADALGAPVEHLQDKIEKMQNIDKSE